MSTNFKEWAAKIGERVISEAEYREASAARREALAERIRTCGLSLNHIAKGTRLSRRTVSRAAQAEEIRQEGYDRIAHYIRVIAPVKDAPGGEILPAPDGVTMRAQTYETK